MKRTYIRPESSLLEVRVEDALLNMSQMEVNSGAETEEYFVRGAETEKYIWRSTDLWE